MPARTCPSPEAPCSKTYRQPRPYEVRLAAYTGGTICSSRIISGYCAELDVRRLFCSVFILDIESNFNDCQRLTPSVSAPATLPPPQITADSSDSDIRAHTGRMSRENLPLGRTADPRRIIEAWHRNRQRPCSGAVDQLPRLEDFLRHHAPTWNERKPAHKRGNNAVL